MKIVPAVHRYIILFVVLATSILMLQRVLHIERSEIVTEQLDSFLRSKNQKTVLTELFPWEWEVLCTTGDYASKKAFDDALGRKATFIEALNWYWYETSSEQIDNLIFFDRNGRIKIYQYDFSGRAPIYLHSKNASRPTHNCFRNSKALLLQKSVGLYGGVSSLILTDYAGK